MIKVQDWLASIPDEDKHIAYVGEDKVEQREFLLCGEGWQAYRDWSFHLDMAFDPESITTRDNRQVVQTTRNCTENKEEAGTIVDEITTKETYTVCNEEMANYSLTDIASLDKEETEDGLRLTWQVLRQHTLLPGKLRATLRAVSYDGKCIKKSAMMVFEVDAAINAVPAARPARSEFEEMEQRMDNLLQDARWNCADANHFAVEAEQSYNATVEAQQQAETDAQAAQSAQAAASQSALEAANAEQNATRAMEICAAYKKQCAEYAAQGGGGGSVEYNRVNVRDYGAVGDGVTDDRPAIIAAFNAAKLMLPCEVYFPAGTYGILSGITIAMEYGTGGLRVCGAGRDVTTIKYLDDYTSGQGWYAIRIWPEGRPDIIPAEEDYLHDISYTGLTVYDPDPIGHALNAKKGDSATEETHGFDLHCCKGVSVTDCQFITVGDEAIDICFCHDVVVMNNRLIGSPGAGTSGGAISIGDGCKGVVVYGNTINGSAPDEVLEDGTVLTKSNAGIVLEGVSGHPTQDVTIIGNTIRNVHGKGISLGAVAEGSGLTNAVVADNIISGCDVGVKVGGKQLKDNIKITNNVIADCLGVAVETATVGNITISGNTIRNIKGNYAIHSLSAGSTSRQYIADNVFENIEYGGVACTGDVVLKDCVFKGLGTAETALDDATYGVYKSGGTLTVSGCVFKNVRMAVLKYGLFNPDIVENTDIETVNKTTGVVDGGGVSITGSATRRIVGCSLTGGLNIGQDNAIVQGTKILYNASSHAIKLNANGVVITGCIILLANGDRAVSETSGKNYNMVANNVVNKSIVLTGAQSVAVNNIDTRVTA